LFDKIEVNPIKSEGNAFVVEEGIKSEVNYHEWSEGTKPEVSFAKIFYLNDHDSRLYLASDTYVQLILGSGMVVSGKNQKAVNALNKWIADNYIEEKVEDGAHSYVIVGNLCYELIRKGKKVVDIDEIDITTLIGAKRDKTGQIHSYTQHVNDRDIVIEAADVAHLKFTSRRQELWGRALAQSIVTPKSVNGKYIESSVEEMWKIEDAMVKIFKSYASPMMMIQFEDVGEDFIEDKQQEFKKMGAGAKIITDKAFKAEVFEVNPASKFDKYIEHMEKDVIEAGTQFASQILTAGFTARASSESASDIIKLKIKRIQRRFGLGLKKQIFDLVLEGLGFNPKIVDIKVDFQFDSESVLSIQDVTALFEKGTIKRSEVRGYLAENTDVKIDMADMEDTLPITSVTPTDKMGGQNKEPELPKEAPKPTESISNNTSYHEEKNRVLQEILDDVKMTKKEIRLKLQEQLEVKEQREFIKVNEESVLRNKKMAILDKLSDTIGDGDND
jgi:hypothetical protein